MSGRETTYWFDGDGTPRVGHTELPDEPDYRNPETRYGEMERRLDTLTDRQRYVVELSWGLTQPREYSFREIAEFMGLNWTTVREHYQAAMKKLTTPSVSP